MVFRLEIGKGVLGAFLGSLRTGYIDIFYVFRGIEYQEQPVRRTLANYFWFRFLRELGWVSRIPSVFAVITSCENEQIPWADMGAQEPT